MIEGRARGAAIATGFLSLVVATASSAQTGDRKPTFSYSLANEEAGRQADGPLFRKASAALAAAREGDGAAFDKFLARNARLELMVRSQTGPGPEKLPFTAQTIRAAHSSCLGPYSYDEGTDWTQLSWICRVDGDAPLSKIMTFHDSPELTLTIWFESGRIKTLQAMEPLPIPGRRLIGMETYAVMKAKP